MSENVESPRNDQAEDKAPVLLPQSMQAGGEDQQTKRRRRFSPALNARLQAIRTLLEAPAQATVAGLPEDTLDEVFPPQDLNIEVAKWTRRRDIPLAILGWSAVILLALWLASHFTQTILVVVIAALLAYALVPLVTALSRIMPRALAVFIVYVVVLAGVGTLVYFVISSSIAQIGTLSHSLGNLVTPKHPGNLTPLEQILQPFGITPDMLNGYRAQLIGQLEGLANGIVPLLTGVAGALLDAILVIILSIYLLFEGSKVSNWLQREVPRSQRGRIRFLLHTIQRIVGGYIRGQLIMSTLIGLLVGIGMMLFHVPYALLLGVLAFILEFIPVLGTLTSGLVCVLMALSSGWLTAVFVLGYFILVHIFEGDIVGPRIVGKAVGLSPMVALIALVAGLELFGIGGALFAAPIAGVLQALIVTLWAEWREAHPDEFRAIKRKVSEKVAENSADHPLSEPPEKLLS